MLEFRTGLRTLLVLDYSGASSGSGSSFQRIFLDPDGSLGSFPKVLIHKAAGPDRTGPFPRSKQSGPQ